MKTHFIHLRALLALTGAGLLTVQSAQAATLYWDGNSTTTGSGDTPAGTWGVDNFWNTDSTGGAGGSFQIGTLSVDDLYFSAGSDAVNAYTVSLNGVTQNARLLTFEDGTVTLNNGTLSLGTGGGLTITTNTVTGSTISSNLTISGAQTFNVAAGRTLTLDTGTFTRNAGSTLNILSTGTITTTMTGLDSASLVNGIIGPWASYGTGASTRYATIDGSNNIVAYTGGTAAATAANVTNTGGTFNYDVAAVGTLGAGANINTLRYTGAGGTIAGALTTNGIMNVSGNALTFSGTVTGGASGLVVNTANGNISFSSVLTSGTSSLIKDGPGRLTLTNAATTFTGTVTVNGGVLQYGDTISQLTSGNITLNGGVIEQRWTESITKTQGSGVGQIQIIGGESGFSENGNTGLTWNIGAVTWGSATFNPTKFVLQTSASQGTSSLTFSSAINLNGAQRTIIANAGASGTATSTLGGALSGTGASGLIKEGSGILILNVANSYSGNTTISAGTLRIAASDRLGSVSNTLIFNGGTLQASGTVTSPSTRAVTMTQTGIIDSNGQTMSIAGNISGAGGLTKIGTGTLTLSGTNGYLGATTLTGGTLSVDASTNLGDSGSNLVFNGGTLQISGTGLSNFASLGRTVVFNSGTTVGLDIANAAHVFTVDQTLSHGAGGFTKAGAGTLVINSAHSYTGNTTISAGTLRLDDGGAISGLINNNALYLINRTGTFATGSAPLNNISGSGSIAAGINTIISINTSTGLRFNALNTTGGGSFALNSVTAPVLGGLVGTSGNLSAAFSSGYSGMTNLSLDTAGNSFTYAGVIDDGATGMSLTKTGAGTQTLTGTNTYTGTTFLNGGTLAVGSGSTIGKLSGTADLNFNGGTLQFNRSTNANIDAINDAATITVNSSSTFSVTSADAGGANANETIGAVTLNAGQMNFNWTNGASSGAQMILTSLSRSGTASANFNGVLGSTGRWRVTGAGSTTAGQIIGPWFTTGGANAGFASTDYAVFGSDFIAAANIAGSAETTWTTAANAYTMSANQTLTATRTITALRNTFATTPTLTLATGANLETYGILNGANALFTIAPGTGGVLTTPTGGGNLYITAGANAITVSAPINNNGGNVTLVKNGSNTLTLSSTTSNFSGGVVLNAGTLSFDDARSIGGTNNTGGSTASITVNGNATIQTFTNTAIANLGTGAITLANGATLTVHGLSRGTTTIGGAVTGSGGVTLTSGSFWSKYSFNSTSNTFTGAITDSRSGNDGINNALLSFNSIADGAGYGNIILNGAADSGITYGTGAIADLNLNHRQIILANNNTVFFANASSQAVNINTDIGFSGTGARQIRFGLTGAANHAAGSGLNTINGKLTDNVGGAFTVTFGGGNWTLAGANSHSGGTVLSTATLNINSSTALGTGTFTISGAGTIGNTSGGAIALTNNNAMAWNSNFSVIVSNPLDFGNGAVSMNATRTITVGGDVTVGGAISGSGFGLIKGGGGTLSLNGLSGYSGATSINQGILSVNTLNNVSGGTSALGAPTTIANGTIGLGSTTLDATLRYTGTGSTTDRVVNLSGTTGAVAIEQAGASGLLKFTSAFTATGGGSKTLTLTGSTAGTGEIAGAIVNNSGTNKTSLLKNGTGTWVLSGTNSYTGTTTVSQGTLLVNGSISTSSLTTVQSGATLGGSGTVGALTVSSGGFINPGNSPDVLDVVGAYTQAGTYNAEITANTVGNGTTGYDQISVTGAVNITGGSLVALFSGGGYAANDLIFILLNDSTDAITGTYTGLAQGATVATYGGFNWNISYLADSTGNTFTGGNDIALMAEAIPEPKAVLLGALGILLLLRRRR